MRAALTTVLWPTHREEHSAAEAKDDSDPLAIAVSCVVVIGIIAEGIHKELKGRRELREWPRLTKHWHEDCTGPVIRNSTGAITSNHSPQMATEDDASVNPVAESGGDSAPRGGGRRGPSDTRPGSSFGPGDANDGGGTGRAGGGARACATA